MSVAKIEESILWAKDNNIKVIAGGSAFWWGKEDVLIGACPFGAALYREKIVTEHVNSWPVKNLCDIFEANPSWLHIAFFSWHYNIQFLKKDPKESSKDNPKYIPDETSKLILKIRSKHLYK